MTIARLTSTAVMARRVEPADSLDFFPTPPYTTRAFCKYVLPAVWPQPDLFRCTALDPCCGQGHMAVALGEYFDAVLSADIFDYGFGAVADFLHPDNEATADWIIFNPPFNLALDFVLAALQRARRGVAMLGRTQFGEGQDRFARLFSVRPPQLEAQYAERQPMHKGRWVVNGKTATAYAWWVWLVNPPHDWNGTRKLWIPPNRDELSEHDDWLNFNGCWDLPDGHKAMVLQREPGKLLSIGDIMRRNERRAGLDMLEPPVPASLGDIARELQGRLV